MSVGSTKGPQLFALPRQPLAQLGVEIAMAWRSSISPPSASCYESFVLTNELSGPTLTPAATEVDASINGAVFLIGQSDPRCARAQRAGGRDAH